jgi:hypothetical protein
MHWNMNGKICFTTCSEFTAFLKESLLSVLDVQFTDFSLRFILSADKLELICL